jgi:hypothetical protein
LVILGLTPISYWMLRSWRTYSLLGGAALLAAGADLADLRPLPALQTGLVAGVALAMFLRNESLWAMSKADRGFVDAYAAIRLELKNLEGTSAAAPPAVYQRSFAELVARLGQIGSPSSDWEELRQDTEKDLKKRLSAMKGGVVPPDDQIESFRREWKDLEDRFAVLIHQKTNFWLLWP